MTSHCFHPVTPPVIAVIVTYGNRRRLLEATVDSVAAQGVKKIVVVNNGARWDVAALLQSDTVEVISFAANTGSAPGFSAGITRALDIGAEMIWLLDDDLCPDADCLGQLLESYLQLSRSCSRNRLAVVAARQQIVQALSTVGSSGFMQPPQSSFLQFSLSELRLKLQRRIWRDLFHRKISPPRLFPVQMAPYGGLLFHRSLIGEIGLPPSNFVLYMDDWEFTHRITAKGGTIAIVVAARLNELEESWHEASSSSFHALLFGPDVRVYYTVRNSTYFETRHRVTNKVFYFVNKTVYLSLLFSLAIACKRISRFRLVLQAVRSGTAGNLGAESRFPLH